jgi:membrane fusion protein (multidrug efflux system)
MESAVKISQTQGRGNAGPGSGDERSGASPQPAGQSRRRRAILVFLAGLAAVAASAAGGYAWWVHGTESTDDAQVEADIVPLSAQVSGTLLKVHVQDNQRVKAGDVLVEIDHAEYQARLKQAEAELEAARAQSDAADTHVLIVEATSTGQLKVAKAQISGSSASLHGADALITFSQAALEAAKTRLSKAQVDLERAVNLEAEGAFTKDALENAQTSYDSAQAAFLQAQAQLDSAQEQKKLAQSKIGEAKGRLDQSLPVAEQLAAAKAEADLAHARVKGAEAALDLARIQLERTTITAPADGKISKLGVREGQTVQPGQLVAELVPIRTYVVANFKETQMKHIRPGLSVRIKIDAFPGRVFEGRVSSISAATGARFSLLPPDNATGNFVKVVQRVPVKIDWVEPLPDVPLQAGLAAVVKVRVE